MMNVSRVIGVGCCTGLLILAGFRFGTADDFLASRVAGAQAGATIELPAGVSTQPVTIDRNLTLRGTSADETTLEVTADQPAVSVTGKAQVTIENLTIQWQLDTSEPDPGPPTAVLVKDARLTLKNCRIVALGNGKRCPSGIMADGFSQLTLEDCTLEGFEFAVNVSGGAEGTVTDSVIRKPGHCGLSVFSDSKLSVQRCIVAESAYHGLRSTGGTLSASDNLILHNKNRGIYLGNKSATATIRGNVFLANATGISAFARTAATIERNVFLASEYAAIDSRDTCQLTIAGNILQENERGIVLYSETGNHHLALGANTFWKNGADVQDVAQADDALLVDARLADPATGRFAATAASVSSAGQGLADQAPMTKLWERWQVVTAGTD